MQIKKKEFELLLRSVKYCYATKIFERLPKLDDFPIEIFQEDNVNLKLLESLVGDYSNTYLKSVALRIVAIFELLYERDSNLTVNLKRIWKLVLESILIIPVDSIVSSIGSQGFLSIPLFKNDIEIENFEFIRLHIWDDSLSSYIDTNTCEKFSIHTHLFYAESWILCGRVVNDRYEVNVISDKTKYSLFTIGYNKSINEVNKHTSCANNTHAFVGVKQTSHEVYMQGNSYTIKAGEFHRSGSEGNGCLSATLFSFSAKNGLTKQSYVVGPSEVDSSEINRKINIDPTELLKKINECFK